MNDYHSVLLLGGTGRTGQRVLKYLLEHGAHVRIIVRSTQKLQDQIFKDPNLTIVETDLLKLKNEELRHHILNCDAVISCLGHTISLKGVFGKPHDLVTQAVKNICRTIESLKPPSPVKVILLSSVSVNHPGRLEERRTPFERFIIWLIRLCIPPACDNQRAADFLHDAIGLNSPYIHWCVIRPDTLLDEIGSDYIVYESLSHSIFKPGSTNIDSVARFICRLVLNPVPWDEWKGKLPVIINDNGMTTRHS